MNVSKSIEGGAQAQNRRAFLRRSAQLAGLAIAGPMALHSLMACGETTAPGVNATLDLSTEVGALNFCYVMTQLEVDLYLRTFGAGAYPGMLVAERTVLLQGYSATSAQIASIKTLVPAGRITDYVLFTYDTVNFYDRASSLGAVRALAEATADGYASAISYVTTPATVTQLTAWATAAQTRATNIRALLTLGAYTPAATTPAAVMARLAPHIVTEFTVRNAGAAA